MPIGVHQLKPGSNDQLITTVDGIPTWATLEDKTPDAGQSSIRWIRPTGYNETTFETLGMGEGINWSGTLGVTAVHAYTSVYNRLRAQAVKIGTTSSAGSVAYLESYQYLVSTGYFEACILFGIEAAALTNTRMFIGFQPTTVSPTNVEPNSIGSCIGLAKLAGTTNQFHMVHGNGSAQTEVGMGTDIGITSSTFYALKFTSLDFGEATVSLYEVGSSTILSQHSVYATSGTALTFKAWLSNNTTAAIQNLILGPIYFRSWPS